MSLSSVLLTTLGSSSDCLIKGRPTAFPEVSDFIRCKQFRCEHVYWSASSSSLVYFYMVNNW